MKEKETMRTIEVKLNKEENKKLKKKVEISWWIAFALSTLGFAVFIIYIGALADYFTIDADFMLDNANRLFFKDGGWLSVVFFVLSFLVYRRYVKKYGEKWILIKGNDNYVIMQFKNLLSSGLYPLYGGFAFLMTPIIGLLFGFVPFDIPSPLSFKILLLLDLFVIFCTGWMIKDARKSKRIELEEIPEEFKEILEEKPKKIEKIKITVEK